MIAGMPKITIMSSRGSTAARATKSTMSWTVTFNTPMIWLSASPRAPRLARRICNWSAKSARSWCSRLGLPATSSAI